MTEVRMSIRIPPEIYIKIMKIKAENRVTITKLIHEGLKLILDKYEKETEEYDKISQ